MKEMKKMSKMFKQQGFTIIELVVVILLLGILTATALPRFMDVTEQAHTAVVDGVEGGLATGAALFRAQWIAGGQSTAAVSQFGNLMPTTGGYPAGLTGGVGPNIADLHTECADIFQNVLQSGAPTIAVSGVTTDTGLTPEAIDQLDVDAVVALNGDYIAQLTAATICTFAYLQDDTTLGGGNVRGLVFNTATGILLRVSL